MFEELGVSNRASAGLDIGFKTVQYRVDLADGGVAPVHLLGDIARASRVMAMLAQIIRRVNQHATGAGSGIVDRVTGTRFKDSDKRIYDVRRWKEFSGLCTGII